MRRLTVVHATLAFAVVALSTACTTTATTDVATGDGTSATVEGRITHIDRDPWAYDGNAVMHVQAATGAARVEIPARLNLCDAPGLDMFASLAIGERVRATGEAGTDGAITVCRGEGHALVRLD